jgi:hypothetical protein
MAPAAPENDGERDEQDVTPVEHFTGSDVRGR